MIGLIQRVTRASVVVEGKEVGAIGNGLLVLLCAERGDSVREADLLLTKLRGYRVFGDAEGKMNRSVVDVDGALLLVPQFTLAADTRSGTRPSFTPAAAPDEARRLFDYFLTQACQLHGTVAAGVFGAHMEVSLTNDGPVTFWLQVKPVEIGG
ncbi:D-aminoacyl-tRNA deacylase [Actimicrobium sp. CCI2.3]|uniref:D-aminoacyl-tRNA deacylase n=1 Tax=Actimicrobium sp. CCI2.3 TaxID=3048616 RepID=UPI002AB43FFB|nr:D-aminoacyl-tRNA deacylase [Actimicrobium sp. CCI2.3]MDY7573473.1 D-aminoacyl-tRNA deacylase [Actimicrobium sp. CCI2.3]MEB0022654.1 D-aminoacyl-tRNA deacylase [Actimicrobium sp. CCI2.3]